MITGFGQVTLSSLTIDAQGIATATATSHGYLKIHTVILISGADQEAINGEWTITAIPNANEVQFDATDSGLTSTTITGITITMKVAPLGWSKPFNDASNFVAVYQSLNPLSRRHFLRVDDSDNLNYLEFGATYFRGYEYMSSAADNGLYGFPPKNHLSRGGNFRKCLATSAGIYFPASGVNISWVLVGNNNQFFFSSQAVSGSDNRFRINMFFGDLISYVPGDVGATGLSIDVDTSSTFYNTIAVSYMNQYTTNFCPRNSKKNHTISVQRWKLWNMPTISSTTNVMMGNQNTILEPDEYSNRVIIYRPFLISDENNATSIRGEMPGIAVALNDFVSLPTRYLSGEIITIGGERFVYMPAGFWSTYYGFFLISLDKDWNTSLLQ